MPITQNGQGKIVYSEPVKHRQFQETGTSDDVDFAICNPINQIKQIQFQVTPLTPGPGVATLNVDVAGNAIIDLTSGGGGGQPGFGIIQPDSGTSPTASVPNDTLTVTSANTDIAVSGNSGTNTLTLTSNSSTSATANTLVKRDSSGAIVCSSETITSATPTLNFTGGPALIETTDSEILTLGSNGLPLVFLDPSGIVTVGVPPNAFGVDVGILAVRADNTTANTVNPLLGSTFALSISSTDQASDQIRVGAYNELTLNARNIGPPTTYAGFYAGFVASCSANPNSIVTGPIIGCYVAAENFTDQSVSQLIGSLITADNQNSGEIMNATGVSIATSQAINTGSNAHTAIGLLVGDANLGVGIQASDSSVSNTAIGISISDTITASGTASSTYAIKSDSTAQSVFVGSLVASNLSGTNTGNITLASVGSSPNSSGASLSGQQLTLQPADASNAGLVSTATQTIAGAKTFTSALTGSQVSTPSSPASGNNSVYFKSDKELHILDSSGNESKVVSTNAGRVGSATLVAGIKTVLTSAVTASSLIMVTSNSVSTGHGSLWVDTIVAGTSFNINSTNVLDNSVVAWMIVEP